MHSVTPFPHRYFCPEGMGMYDKNDNPVEDGNIKYTCGWNGDYTFNHELGKCKRKEDHTFITDD